MTAIGQMDSDELWNINYDRMARYMRKYVPFIDINKSDRLLDMGEKNPKMEYLKDHFGVNVTQAHGIDFNFDSLSDYYAQYDAVFALEVVEHLQNPLFFLSEIKKCLTDNGSIYVTIPANPRWMWMDGHYNEIKKPHFEKWILRPLGLNISRYKRINFVHDWRGLLIGYRPLKRVIVGSDGWKSLVRSVFYYKYDVYEIKKDL